MLSATSDGGRIATGCDDGSVWLWSLTLPLPLNPTLTLTLNPNQVWLWSRAQRACLHTLHGHADVVTSVALLGATLASGSLDDTVKVWGAG